MIWIFFEAIKNSIWAWLTITQDWLTVAASFQGIAVSTETGYVCPYCGRQCGRFEYCQGCGAQL